MIAQHTPGPWKAFKKSGKHIQADEWSTECEGAGSSTHAPIKAGKQVVALVVASSRSWSDLPDIGPNARLIAAAPELLQALINLEEAARCVQSREWDMQSIQLERTKAQEVIAKAIGEPK